MEGPERHFAPIEYHPSGDLPLEDHGLIGDGRTAALVGRDGAVSWLCVPRFDSPVLFARLLDSRQGGAFTVTPAGLVASRQYYEPDTAVLVTEMRSPEGLLRVTDACVLRPAADLTEDVASDRGELVREVQVVEGRVRVRVSLQPFDAVTHVEPRAGGLRLRLSDRPELDLQLTATRPLDGTAAQWDLVAGDRVHLILDWRGICPRRNSRPPGERMEDTRAAWRRWMKHVAYEGPHRQQVHRSAITLKLLDNFDNGAMVAAPTSSLPEWPGSHRNWDYRYAWIRDAAFSVYALRRIGLAHEARGFLGWVLDAIEAHGRPCVMYTLDGQEVPQEQEDGDLAGYLGSRPVRWGNDASLQKQHDVFGEVLDCAYQWVRHGGHVEPHLWERLRGLAERARTEWREPDHGIWEVRTAGCPYTYSAALCQVAVDRAARIAEAQQLDGSADAWRADADRIGAAIVQSAWDPEQAAFTERLGGGALDASVLALPLRRVLDARHPRMRATTESIVRGLGAGDGLLYRYLPQESPDGVGGEEGAFLLCSFWLADNLLLQGRVEEAEELFGSLCARASPLGLLPEQIDPTTGAFLGNFPQAMSHVGLVATAVRLTRNKGGRH